MILLADTPFYTIVAVSNDFVSTSGRRREEVIGSSHFTIFPENPADTASSGVHSLRNSFEYILQHKTSHNLPLVRYDIPDGKGGFLEKYWKSANAPVLNDLGEVEYIIHTSEDVTALVKAEQSEEAHQQLLSAYQKVEESEQKYRNLFESIDQGFCLVELIYNEEGKAVDHLFLETNPLFEAQTGLKNVHGKTAREVAPAIEEYWFELYDQVIQTGKPLRFTEESKALGRWFDVYVYPAGERAGKKVAVLFADVTERKKVEQALRSSEEQFRLMADTIPLSIWITDAEGRVEYLNKHWYDYSGVSSTEKTAADFIKYLHPEDGPKVMQVFGNAMKTGEPWQVEQRNLSKDGEYRWFLNSGTPYKDPITGQVVKWFGVGIDIHDRKLAEEALRASEEALEKKVNERTHELEKANQELKRSNQNLEEFAYAASHDMKEPIRKIHFFADRLKERLVNKLEGEDLRYFERLESGTKRMTTLIDDLLIYSHVNRGITSVETLDLNQVLSFVLDDLELHIEQKGAQVEIAPLPTIVGRPRQLQQLFENLIGNALKYSRKDVPPVVQITTHLVKGKDTGAPAAAINADRMYHLIQVQDNGIGFDQIDAERIFTVFTRLHGNTEYRGTGIGLSIAQRVVQNHGGYIWAESTAGRGATFQILFPSE